MNLSGFLQSEASLLSGFPEDGFSQQLVLIKPVFQIIIKEKAFPDAQSALAYIKTM
jgi:hypothetical protein